MKKIFYLTMLTLAVFLFSHCQFQTSSAKRENNWNKHLLQSDGYYSNEFQFNDIRLNGMDYRIYFGQAHYPGGVAIINKTNDKLMKTKLELEIQVLRNELKEINESNN